LKQDLVKYCIVKNRKNRTAGNRLECWEILQEWKFIIFWLLTNPVLHTYEIDQQILFLEIGLQDQLISGNIGIFDPWILFLVNVQWWPTKKRRNDCLASLSSRNVEKISYLSWINHNFCGFIYKRSGVYQKILTLCGSLRLFWFLLVYLQENRGWDVDPKMTTNGGLNSPLTKIATEKKEISFFKPNL
jgi:hypothetical protein